MGKYLDIVKKFEAELAARKGSQREHENEHAVNTEQKSCSRTVNTGLSPDLPLGSGERDVTLSPAGEVWLCPHCGIPAEIEGIEPSLDGQRLLTFWKCDPCQTWGVTPSTLREPPVWVSSKEQ